MDIREGDLDDPQVRALIALHVDAASASTPHGFRHPLDLTALRQPGVTFWTAWDGDTLLGMAALRTLTADHAEVKSMRTAPAALRRGVARTLLDHLTAVARTRGHTRISLETGTAPGFDAANQLYERAGFVDGPVFGGYPPSPHNRFMTMAL